MEDEPKQEITIEPLTELEKLKLQVVMARHRATAMERENLVLQFLANNPQAKGLDVMVKNLAGERNQLIATWCEMRGLKPEEYAIDEETGKFVKMAP